MANVPSFEPSLFTRDQLATIAAELHRLFHAVKAENEAYVVEFGAAAAAYHAAIDAALAADVEPPSPEEFGDALASAMEAWAAAWAGHCRTSAARLSTLGRGPAVIPHQ